ncbi:unnamed protein product [Rotaria sp. Silwood1]|nr:unnamed protein product [Rotaria sp. Silwood1]CAF4540212.1 unnamed protein product [Rotaria sp. Silwood1]
MASSSSPTPVFTKAVIGQDDSAPSPIQRQRQQYQNPTRTSYSHLSDDDDDGDGDDDSSENDDIIEALDKHPSSSALHEVNDALMGVLKSHVELIVQHSSPTTSSKQATQEEYNEINTIIENTKIALPTMHRLIQQNPLISPYTQSSQTSIGDGKGASSLISTPLLPPLTTSTMPFVQSPLPPPKTCTPSRSSETNEVVIYPSSISLKGLLSYQDVLNAIEREFHLHEGQEREIIMKLWLKGQTMISILQRYRHLLQDLNLDDEDFLGGMKHIREMINYGDRDVQYLREQAIMLENQNHFLENEFHRQLDKLVMEKNEQISRLIQIIDQTCPPPTEYTDRVSDLTQSSGNQDLATQKFMQQNVELQRQLETLRAKLEYTFTLLNEKLDQHTGSATSSIIQVAIQQMRQSDIKIQELQLKFASQQEENDLLKYLSHNSIREMDKSQRSSNLDATQLFSVIEQRSLEREISRVRHELELTEKKLTELEQRFENSDETVKFNIESLKLRCDVLRQHIATCDERLDEAIKEAPVGFTDDMQTSTHERQYQNPDSNVIRLENELLALREQYSDLAEYSNTLKYELDSARKQLHERSLLERDSYDSSLIGNDTSELEHERQRSAQLENELISLKIKYEDVCERVTAATIQLERVQVVLEQTLRRCEQLEKEKSEINAQSEYLSQNVASVTAKYKDKMNTIKSRLEHTDRERREAQIRTEQLQNEIERLKNELTHKKEMIYEKDKLIQDAQYKSREIIFERQSVEDRISNEYKRLNELVDKNRLLEEELERMRRSQILENITVRRTDVINLDAGIVDSSNRIEELRSKINEFERRFSSEKASKESLQVQIKILEEENADLRDIMSQMRKRAQDDRRTDRDRNDEIQQLIARAESNARQYMSNFNIATTSPTSTLVRIIPISSPTKIS